MSREQFNDVYSGNQMEHDKSMQEIQLQHKFFLFIISLIFASLSLSLQFQANSLTMCFKYLELTSWVAYMFSGLLGLILLRFSIIQPIVKCDLLREILQSFREVYMWGLFFLATILQIACRFSVLY